jgi:hypothetical protein
MLPEAYNEPVAWFLVLTNSVVYELVSMPVHCTVLLIYLVAFFEIRIDGLEY